MPCMGPNLDYAREQGRKVGQEILTKLLDDHKMWGPIHWPNAKLPTKNDISWERLKENFVKAVEELFVEDACNSF